MSGRAVCIDASSAAVASTIGANARARAGGADPAGRAPVVAAAAARGIARNVDTHAVAILRSAVARHAAAARVAHRCPAGLWADLPAIAAIPRVVREIDADRTAGGVTLGAAENTAAGGAPGHAVGWSRAGGSAAAAVQRVAAEHGALLAAHRLTIAARLSVPRARVRTRITHVARDTVAARRALQPVQAGRQVAVAAAQKPRNRAAHGHEGQWADAAGKLVEQGSQHQNLPRAATPHASGRHTKPAFAA